MSDLNAQSEELSRAFKRVGLSIEKAIERGIETCAIVIEGDAKEFAPVDTGNLKGSINHEVRKEPGLIVGEVGTNVEYAPYMEFGTGIYNTLGNGRNTPWMYQDAAGVWHKTVGNKPQAFLTPALTENQSKVQGIIAESIRKEL